MALEFASAAPLTRADFQRVQRFIHRAAGIALGDEKQALVVARLERRLRALACPSWAAYLDHLDRSADEAQRATDALTTNETSFFREAVHFDFLRELPRPPGRRLRLWSAACSSGEEAWSAAMTFDAAATPFEVHATDISTRVLELARAAVYPLAEAEGVPAPLRSRYLLRGVDEFEGHFTLAPALRAHVSFSQRNLLDPHEQLGAFDVVFLRNVLIYFDRATKVRVIGQLIERLHPAGALVISVTETLQGLGLPLRSLGNSIYQRAR